MIDRRSMLQNLLAGAAGLSFFRPGDLIAADDPYLSFVNPELRGVAAKMLQRTPGPPLSLANLKAVRMGMGRWNRPFRKDVPVERKVIPGRKGQPDVPIYVVNARPGLMRPAILHLHGGGFVLGSAAQSVADLQDLSSELGCLAVSVEYRLAPETSYAGSIEDNYAGLKWLHANALALGADRARIAVMGESAGGGHAALLAITARNRGEVPLVFQCLVYPMLDDRTGSTRAAPAHMGKLVWNAQANRFGWESFLGQEPGGRRVPFAAVPARVANLAGLPPAFIGVGSIDLFHDEDVEYARRLNDAAVPTELLVVPGAFHGFDGIAAADPNARVARWFTAVKKDALRRGLGIAV
ncbi:alpha/beta hydrolase [Novosphingobium sp.]|uniref:alpha/beta hydrolase n=1 Tax=Novosphingobium sp. TaxID=1874826 RepID=UPI002B49703B|nr:alpha/beta hydrolase [Novosphingobium sp.]HKR92833.1 alpha/beta hydrolase [Novosphingobium sp.]